ncbi:fibrinogen like 1B [Scleropages formosus]|uniref:Fibrinogen like 1B n=1 Tax=Scleropages formosus TaxID=113540 RepID=A0A8C9R7A7_SCLFO|nr:fibrinogen-like protein 1 [Scleropages formosus]XP_018610721.1 fibrinogen-like protein 1 [Scleropages formosus]
MRFLFVVFLLVLICHIRASPRLSPEEECRVELLELRHTVSSLENKLFIGEWQLRNLREHNHFYRPHKATPPPGPNMTADVAGVIPTSLPHASGNLIVYDRDCAALYDRIQPLSGFYRIKPTADLEPFLVYCDMSDGGGWTVLQQRRSGKVDFNRNWDEYKEGFGNFKMKTDEFWLGNEHMYALLKGGENLMKFDLTDWSGEKTHALYENFKIADEKDKYRLQFGLYSGLAGDALSGGGRMEDQWSISHNSMQFSTRDQDNDRFLKGSCAKENKGGWWFNRCHAVNLNGKYYRSGEYKGKYDNGVVWLTWRGLWYSLHHTTMKVRPLRFMDSLGSGAGAGAGAGD